MRMAIKTSILETFSDYRVENWKSNVAHTKKLHDTLNNDDCCSRGQVGFDSLGDEYHFF